MSIEELKYHFYPARMRIEKRLENHKLNQLMQASTSSIMHPSL